MGEALSHQIAERARSESRAEIEKLESSLARKEKELQDREESIETHLARSWFVLNRRITNHSVIP
jgi:hypothetical protein